MNVALVTVPLNIVPIQWSVCYPNVLDIEWSMLLLSLADRWYHMNERYDD